ncbi:hypothetical protein [Marinobacter nitratireducens]|uniref:hypothetical protein n=1 Tax=Marinobacter nitratireducens TaxID=1137280 RepID=UPI0005688353|nr:hypothetical protein [Marinobacter nitratireducens]
MTKMARTELDALPVHPLRGMLEAKDGRKQAYMDVLAAVPRRGCTGNADSHAEANARTLGTQQT